MMWCIVISGYDTGISISGSDYYSALKAAIEFMAEEFGIADVDAIDVMKWVWA